MEKTIIGVDQGNGNIKTRHCVFPCGYVKQETKPSEIFAKHVIEYEGNFYSLVPSRLPYEIDKTKNENCKILTLFGTAMEIVEREKIKKPDFDFHRDFKGFIGKDIYWALGLPASHLEKLKEPHLKYFLEEARYGINFKYNGKSLSFHVKDIFIFPQGYAAIMIYKPELIKKYSTVHCIDIGDGTVDLITLKNGIPDKSTMASRELGMSRLREQIIDAIINDYSMTLDGSTIEDILTPGREVLAPDEVAARVRQEVGLWARRIVDQLHTKVPDFRFAPTVFCGGGSELLAPFLEETGMFGMTEYIADIHANAVGYEEIAKLYLKD